MKKIFFGLFLLASTNIIAQVGIGTTDVETSAILELDSSNLALLLPRVANTAAISNPVNGMLIFDLSSLCIKGFENGKWTACLNPGLNEILVQVGYEGDNPNTIISEVTAIELASIPGVVGVNPSHEQAYQNYIDVNPNLFSAPATVEEINAMIPAVTSNGTALVSAYTCNTASSGILTAGTAVSGVSQTITATVTTVGTYSISTTANGVTFSASGTFAGTGAQNIVLTATGTPTVAGSNSFTLNTTPNCSFSRTTIVHPSSNGTSLLTYNTCAAESVGNMSATVPVNNVYQTITANVTTPGTYAISATANGVTFSASGTFTNTGAQNIILYASGTPVNSGLISYTLNTTPNCTFNRTVITLPSGFIFTIPQRPETAYASVYDNDYLPYAIPTQPASLVTPQVADGITDPLINIQGIITSANRNLGLRYSDTSSSGVTKTVPAYSTTVNIPAIYTEDGISRDVTFSWNSFSYTTPVTNVQLIARITAIGGNINLKKLDLHNSLGNDGNGILLNTFHYPKNNSGETNTHPLRIMAGMPDRNFVNATNKYFYATVTSATGRVWLKNNLGTFFNNINKFTYNPSNQGVEYFDYRQKGDSYQWGRLSDGHELIEWSNNSGGGLAVARVTTTTVSPTDTPATASVITINGDWRSGGNNNLWQGVNGINNPCPLGFRLPTSSEFQAEIDQYEINNLNSSFNSILQLGTTGYGSLSTGSMIEDETVGYYWTSTVSGTQSTYLKITSSSAQFINDHRAKSCAVRCIKD